MATMSSKYTPWTFVRNLALFMLFAVSPSVFCWTHQEESDLRKKLLKNYDKTLRPVKEMRDVMQVHGELMIGTAREFDIVYGYITVQAYLTLKWCDEFLSWSTSLHNITNISIQKEMIWHPGIMLYNTATQTDIKALPQLLLNNDGCVEKMMPLYFKSFCEVNAYGFPFDEHRCKSNIFFTDYDVKKVMLTQLNCTEFQELSETNWRIEHSCSVENHLYSEGIIELSLTRNITANSLYNLLPAIIFLLLNMMVGQLLVQSGEKVSFATTIFLANIVYLANVNNKLPKEPTHVPLMFWCHLLLTSLSGISVIASIVVSKRFFKMHLPEPIAPNKVNPENCEMDHVCKSKNTTSKEEIPEKFGPSGNNLKVKNFIRRFNVEVLMFNIISLVSVIFGIVFLSLFLQLIASRN